MNLYRASWPRRKKEKASPTGNLIFQRAMAELFLRETFFSGESFLVFCFIRESDLAAKQNGGERKGQNQQSTWEMESHDSKNEIKWRRNFVCFHIMNFFYNRDDDDIQRKRVKPREETIKYVNGNFKSPRVFPRQGDPIIWKKTHQ